MKQQGETTSTVERIRGLQSDIQELRSQNDSLKAEIEAQQAAHKAQLNAAENRAHDSWLAARQTQRRFEETMAEASVLRRKLTSLSDSTTAADNSSLPSREYLCFRLFFSSKMYVENSRVSFTCIQFIRHWMVPTVDHQPSIKWIHQQQRPSIQVLLPS